VSKFEQLEDRVSHFLEATGATGCLVASKAGQGDVLYDRHLDGVDGPVVSTLLSSLLLLGEKLAEEFGQDAASHQVLQLGRLQAVLVPCGDGAAFLAVLRGQAQPDAAIAACLTAGGDIGRILGASRPA
jgi:predicted regulator of Ras-like GTPase activity (Roadblock/LC7/MglB family)